MNRRLYAVHRWISALALVQLAAWVTTGTFFAIVSIDRVRGTFVPHAHDRPIVRESGLLSHGEAFERAVELGVSAPSRIELRATPSGLFFFAHGAESVARFDARSAQPAPVTESEAKETARRDQPGHPEVRAAVLLEQAGVEYRGKPLPAWRIQLDDAGGTAIYVDARTGDVTARRNDLWRWYDFFWSLHIMDYGKRESFNHPLLVAAGALGVATVLSGVAVWITRFVRWVRGRRTVEATEAA